MYEIKIEPEKTFALVIGIDRYPKLEGLDATWRLNNTVREAFEFTRWLLDRGLSADQIMLFVSGADAAEAPNDKDGKAVVLHDSSEIRSVINENPFNPSADENLLFVYWAGHGSTDYNRRQLLWDQNYDRDNDRLVYDLEEVKPALRSENWRKFTRQIILVNACANALPGELNKHPFNKPSTVEQNKRKQFTIYAALPGEPASDGDMSEPSEFFKLLLKTLKEKTRRDRPFSMAKVWDAICEDESLKNQTPRIDCFDWNDNHYVWDGDELIGLIYEGIGKGDVSLKALTPLAAKTVEIPEKVEGVRQLIGLLNAAKFSKKTESTTAHGPILDFALHAISRHKLSGLEEKLEEHFKKRLEFPTFIHAREQIAAIIKREDEESEGRVAPALNLKEYEQYIKSQQVKDAGEAQPYLLGDKFAGREKELNDLTEWLRSDAGKMFVICDLGGTGKSALVWRWWKSEAAQDILKKEQIEQYWCTFYARNFTSAEFLRKLATKLGREVPDDPDISSLQRFILNRLKEQKWLLILDGLEREMGAFAEPEHFQIDSEEQDRRNEAGYVLEEEKAIRSQVFAPFLSELLETQTKVLITSRLFPENLKLGDQPAPGVIHYPFLPMSESDANEVWNLYGEPDRSKLKEEFFQIVGYHPQVIAVVSSAVRESRQKFNDWFQDFSEEERNASLDHESSLTARRHRWLELATRDLTKNRRDCWLTLCYIVRRSEASAISWLMKKLVGEDEAESSPGRFRSESALIEVLKYLQSRGLLGADFTRDLVDIHPVIRCQVMRYILRQYEPGGEIDEDLVRHIGASNDRSLMLRFLSQSNPEERFKSISPALDEISDLPPSQNLALPFLAGFYLGAETGGRPWLSVLPSLRLRREQAYVLMRTGYKLMERGQWEESEKLFNRAIVAYRLCDDPESADDCRRSHNWQSLYGGGLFKAEREQLVALEKYDGDRPQSPHYWLALLLSIRQHKRAREFLESIPEDTSRWHLQTVAESWFYLDEYDKAADLARQSLDLREREKGSVAQLLWERVTLGLALVRLGRGGEALGHLDFANARGKGWYNLVALFALAGMIECRYEDALKINSAIGKHAELSSADGIYRQFCKFNHHDGFQIPASEAHLAMARVHHARREMEEAIELANRALKIAIGQEPPFQYASAVERAKEFLSKQLKQPVPAVKDPSLKAQEHEERLLQKWLDKWLQKRNSR